MLHTAPSPRRAPGRLAAFCVAAALALLLGACGSGAVPTTFDLTALPGAARSGAARRSIVVAEPVGLQPFEADRIIVREPGGAVSYLGGGQWADRLPRLVQTRLIQSLENANRLKSVSRPGDKVAADTILITELRAFDINAGTREAVVDLSAKLIQESSGTVVAAKVFQARVPVAGVNAPVAANGLDRALSMVLADIVRWINAGG
ncbi:cholesterol transport system auxiliary component [Methylobacterium sp. 174MFSha1.1]|uniref:ABC-type transport auxiliary lipoprotein family protein n=1 Tax=Methylobacterium sp. 174MFSha1.1 TaxID=1502749 RepID=UPI0008DF82F9|nr:ABC-type transport auxiliary lipoprotein family protein [Methylobacterium sp. 174MFSha1.1]SFU65798.1 cholesterol transport system auxiliary component [Methylobacterium sp. 174MFSha1.1]